MDDDNLYLDYAILETEGLLRIRLVQSAPMGSYDRSQANIPLESLAKALAPYLKPKKPAKKVAKKRAKK